MNYLRNLPGDPLDSVAIRAQFPVLQREIKGHRMAFLDSAASSQKPQRVIDSMSRFYETINANVHRGCLLYTSPSPRDRTRSRMPSSA